MATVDYIITDESSVSLSPIVYELRFQHTYSQNINEFGLTSGDLIIFDYSNRRVLLNRMPNG